MCKYIYTRAISLVNIPKSQLYIDFTYICVAKSQLTLISRIFVSVYIYTYVYTFTSTYILERYRW